MLISGIHLSFVYFSTHLDHIVILAPVLMSFSSACRYQLLLLHALSQSVYATSFDRSLRCLRQDGSAITFHICQCAPPLYKTPVCLVDMMKEQGDTSRALLWWLRLGSGQRLVRCPSAPANTAPQVIKQDVLFVPHCLKPSGVECVFTHLSKPWNKG